MRISGIVGKILITSLMIAAVFGCAGGGGSSGSSIPEPTVRYFNIVPDSTALSFSLNQDVKADALPYLGSTPGFAKVKSDSYDAELKDANTNQSLWAEVYNLGPDTDYLIVSLGLQNYGADTLKRARLAISSIDLTRPNGNRARLLILNAYNRAPGFDNPGIDFQNPGDNPQFKAAGIQFGTSGNLDVDSGVQTFEVRRESTENVYATSTPNLVAGGVYLVIFTGIEGGVGAQAPQISYQLLNP